MRTYDKLIATIHDRQGTGDLRPYFGLRAAPGRSLMQQAGRRRLLPQVSG
ncbi:hypothetical protein OOT46_08665 [Aquabacterium sp. A7-Y]|nr:hypothetical protein [Aquabacterium sp. A7-Y]MCW7537920.1 hypothetical protein [Aquabacterium sp. A7-Y]